MSFYVASNSGKRSCFSGFEYWALFNTDLDSVGSQHSDLIISADSFVYNHSPLGRYFCSLSLC